MKKMINGERKREDGREGVSLDRYRDRKRDGKGERVCVREKNG